MVRGWMIATAVLLTLPAQADGFGGSTDKTTTTTQTTKSQDGDTTTTTTTTRSETTSSGGGFSFGDVFGNSHGNGHDDGATYENTGGSWKIGNDAKLCDLTLDKSKFISNYGARTGIGCPEGLFGVSSWMLAGDEIRLFSPGGTLLAKLHRTGHGRWDGKTEAGLAIFMTRD